MATINGGIFRLRKKDKITSTSIRCVILHYDPRKEYKLPIMKRKCNLKKSTDTMEGTQLTSVSKLHFVFIFWISTLHLWYQPGHTLTSIGKSEYCLILLNSCLAEADRSEELAFLKPFLEKSFMKRSFRNGVGSGFKKNSFRRAKS
ncbi:neuropeptide S [Gastrophryne carolinensis]